jgi:hypothetical protein
MSDLDCKDKIEFPQLNQWQVDVLEAAANGLGKVLVVLCSNEKDKKEDRERLDQQARDARKLIELGFMKDISNEFQDSVKMARASYGRECFVVTSTDLADAMFKFSFKDELVN